MAINGSKEKLIKTFQIRHMIKLLERNKDKNNKSKKWKKFIQISPKSNSKNKNSN